MELPPTGPYPAPLREEAAAKSQGAQSQSQRELAARQAPHAGTVQGMECSKHVSTPCAFPLGLPSPSGEFLLHGFTFNP